MRKFYENRYRKKLVRCLVAHSGRKRGNRQTDTRTDRLRTKYVTLAAHARRGLIRTPMMNRNTFCIGSIEKKSESGTILLDSMDKPEND